MIKGLDNSHARCFYDDNINDSLSLSLSTIEFEQ